jgi:hypothetical protein
MEKSHLERLRGKGIVSAMAQRAKSMEREQAERRERDRMNRDREGGERERKPSVASLISTTSNGEGSVGSDMTEEDRGRERLRRELKGLFGRR